MVRRPNVLLGLHGRGLTLIVSGTGCSADEQLLGTWSTTSYEHGGDLHELP